MALSPLAFASVKRLSLPNHWDLIAFTLVLAVLVAMIHGARGMGVALPPANVSPITLNYAYLPYYALRSTLRMFIAILFSLAFTFLYATIAAKSRRAEVVLIPLLDVLQSVPILGFLSFTVIFFLGLFPGSTLGAEAAAIFAIFTSQAWNMAFSFYQSLKTVPRDLEEVARSLRLSGWQRFWQLETPFAVPGLMWNTMMSMSGGWFFVVASEAITVGNTTVDLPGIGSYLAVAIEQRRIDAVFAAVVAMFIVILLYDQLLFRPIVAWAGKFRVELSAGQITESSWVLSLFRRTRWMRAASSWPIAAVHKVALWRLDVPVRFTRSRRPGAPDRRLSRLLDVLWYGFVAVLAVLGLWLIVAYSRSEITWADLLEAIVLSSITLIRVVALLALATLFWVPISVWIGFRPSLAEKVQPLAQFLAAFPANVVFPVAVVLILRFSLTPDIWLSFLIIFGTQWYIVFNVIAGAAAFPNDLKEASANLRVRGFDWWFKVVLPGIFPYYVTGALTASGGSWNAAIVAEYVRWGNDKVAAHGIGAYIAQATRAGDYPRILLGVAVMSVFVIFLNRLFWRPLFAFAERHLRIS